MLIFDTLQTLKILFLLCNYISGYVYLIFDSEKSVKALLASCTHDFCNGGDWYFKISSRRMRCKEVTDFSEKLRNSSIHVDSHPEQSA